MKSENKIFGWNFKEYHNRSEQQKLKVKTYKQAVNKVSYTTQQKFKRELKKKRLFTCERCYVIKVDKGLLIHHKIEVIMNYKLWNDENNCSIVCYSCHQYIHYRKYDNLGFFCIEFL